MPAPMDHAQGGDADETPSAGSPLLADTLSPTHPATTLPTAVMPNEATVAMDITRPHVVGDEVLQRAQLWLKAQIQKNPPRTSRDSPTPAISSPQDRDRHPAGDRRDEVVLGVPPRIC